MKTNGLNQTIQETLELCISKMSKTLQNNFDPEDKNSIKLLQQFRSTLNTLRTWIKHANTAVNESMNTVKNVVKNTVNKINGHKAQDENIAIHNNYPNNKELDRLKTLMNQPSGLQYASSKG